MYQHILKFLSRSFGFKELERTTSPQELGASRFKDESVNNRSKKSRGRALLSEGNSNNTK